MVGVGSITKQTANIVTNTSINGSFIAPISNRNRSS
jgi:hypothetical protein